MIRARVTLRSPKLLASFAVAVACAAASVPARVALAEPSAAGASDADSKHTVAIYVEGPKSQEVRDAIAKAFPENVTVTDDQALKQALAKEHQKLPVGLVLLVPAQRKPTLGRFGKAASDVGAEAIVVAQSTTKKTGTTDVLVLYVKADDSSADVDKTLVLDGSFDGAVKDTLESEIAPMRPAPKVEAPKDDGAARKDGDKGEPKPDDGKPKRPPNTHGRQILDAFLAFDLGGRFFSYNDGLTSNLRDYNVFGAPGVSIAAGVYPLAMLDVPVVKDLGIVGDFRIAFALGSQTKEGTKVDTAWNRFDVGLRYRLPLAKQVAKGDKAVVLGASGTFGRDAFLLNASGTLGQEAPSVEYFFLRGGLDAEFPAGPIFLTVRGGYVGALSSGSVYSRFRDSSIGGIDVGGGITVPIALGFEGRLTGEYIRWFYAFGPLPGDPYVAGGALDQYVHLELGPAYVF